ncbi:hypothetical protein RHGRI_020239 [Rhododendron griersonianum]|uniref:Uncharacterized protein n=1 Tax=Rhododendron griersonianum TaxID=479676 RepID=A0AAV6JJI6_9ERIC|nr:hypothetical protein RHGRI_020239 [Rhododendron griersonianum]
MWVAVVSLFLYCLAYDSERRLSSSRVRPAYYARVVRGGMGLSGSLLSISLASLLFQDSVWLLLYFLYIVLSNRQMMCHRLDVLWSWLREKIMAGLPSGPHRPERRLLPV